MAEEILQTQITRPSPIIEEAQKGFSGQYFKKDGFDRSMKEY